MSKAKYERRGSTIIVIESGLAHDYKTINKAKRESRRLQIEADRALGRGSLRVKS